MKFEKRVILESVLVNALSLGLILIYSLSSTRLPLKECLAMLKFCIPAAAFFIFIGGTAVNYLTCRKTAASLQMFDSGQGDEKFRTALLMDLHRQPRLCLFLTMAYFLLADFTAISSIRLIFHLDKETLFAISVEWFFGAYFAALLAYSFRLRLCAPYANCIVRKGVSRKFVAVKKNFGFSIRSHMLLYIAVPLVLTTLVTLMLYFFTLPENLNTFASMANEALSGQGIGRIAPRQLPPKDLVGAGPEPSSLPAGLGPFIGMTDLWSWRIKCTAIFNAIIICAQTMIFFLNFMHKNQKAIEGLEALQNSSRGNSLSSDLSDELSYNIYLINCLILKFQSIIANSVSIARMITDSSASLSKISDEAGKNADSQSSKTGGIINRMDDNKRMSKEIDGLANNVAAAAQETAKDMGACALIMEKTLSNMQDIGRSNESTLDSIKELQQKVAAIWQIVNMINAFAEQTKIIAFNTELESSAQGGEKKSFLNVAIETRRLANSIADSTKDIKDYIRQIEATEEQLLVYSASNTDEIRQGLELSRSIESSFSRVNGLSAQNAAATEEIKNLVQNQTVAFEQIRQTLIQIGGGIRSFTLSASSLVTAAEELNAGAADLSMTGSTSSTEGKK